MLKNFGETTIKAALTGTVAAAGSALLFGETQNSNIGGMQLPTYLVIGGANAVGSWVSDTFSDNIISKIPQNPQWAHAESLAVRLGLAGGASAIAMKVTTGLPNENILKAGALGAASKASAEWINDNIISAKRNGFLMG